MGRPSDKAVEMFKYLEQTKASIVYYSLGPDAKYLFDEIRMLRNRAVMPDATPDASRSWFLAQSKDDTEVWAFKYHEDNRYVDFKTPKVDGTNPFIKDPSGL